MSFTVPISVNVKARDLGFYSYQDYLTRSPHWHMLKRQHDRIPCYSCGDWKAFNLDLHHKTYERLGQEVPSDLVRMCKFCHKLGHDLIEKKQATLDNMHQVVKALMIKQADQMGLPLEAA